MFYYDDSGYIPTRPVFNLETVLPPVKRMQPPSAANVQTKSQSRVHGSHEVKWEAADDDQTSSNTNPILFRRRPWKLHCCSPVLYGNKNATQQMPLNVES